MKIYPFKKTVFNCRQATRLALKKEQGKISLWESVKLFYHLLYCNPCKRFIQQSAIINKISKGIADTFFKNPPHKLSSETKENIQRQLNNVS